MRLPQPLLDPRDRPQDGLEGLPHVGRDDPRPLFVRFSTWLIVALLLPNVLFGVLVLTHDGPPLGYTAALLLGALVSAIHGVTALLARLRERWRRRHDG